MTPFGEGTVVRMRPSPAGSGAMRTERKNGSAGLTLKSAHMAVLA